MGTEKFCLKWNDFESNISHAFREIRDEKDFFDVTLACDDDQLQAHKVILSACSPFFRKVLKRNPHQHPLLYLKGVKYTDLQSVLNFMYHGEVNVAQDELNSFLAVAEELRVKGLTQNNGSSQSGGGAKSSSTSSSGPKSPLPSKSTSSRPSTDHHPRDSATAAPPPPKRPRPNPTNSSSGGGGGGSVPPPPTTDDDDIQEVVPVKSEPREITPHNSVIANAPDMVYQNSSNQQSLALAEEDDMSYAQDESYDDYGQYGDQSGYDGQLIDPNMTAGADGNKGQEDEPVEQDLDQYITKNADVGGSDSKKYSCSICGKVSHKSRSNIRNHIESKHFPGRFQYACDHCPKMVNTKTALFVHKSAYHAKMSMNRYQNM